MMVHFYYRITTFFIGVAIGILLAIKYKTYLEVNTNLILPAKKFIPSYHSWFENQGLKREAVLWDQLRYRKHNNFLLESRFLYEKIRVACVVLVRNTKNVKAVEDTWGKGCNNLTFIELKTRGNKAIPIKRTKENSSWVLLCQTLKSININGKYDWALVVNDNTFVILENLRYYLAVLSPSDKYYLGYAVMFWNTVYNAGEAGYVLSKGSLEAFNKKYEKIDCSTNTYWNREDFYLGKYLASLNITPIDTRDTEGLSTFHPYNWYHVFFPGENYYKTSVFPIKCCSQKSITFQAIEADKMYSYYYLLYVLQIFFDGKLGNLPAAVPIPEEQVWKEFLRERNVPSDNITSAQYYKLWEDLVDHPNLFAAHMRKEVYFDYE